MSINLVHLGKMVWLLTPTALELLVWIRVLVCGHTIPMRVWRIGTISLAVMKNPESSASAAEDVAYLIICVMVRIGHCSVELGHFM